MTSADQEIKKKKKSQIREPRQSNLTGRDPVWERKPLGRGVCKHILRDVPHSETRCGPG